MQFEDKKSKTEIITTGVPQGSILGPLLFIIYINDICRATDYFDVIIYADDTTLCSSIKVELTAAQNSKNINDELQNISIWLKSNKLSLNTNKTKCMIFHNIQKKVDQPEIKLNGKQIETVSSFNYLGILLDTALTFKNHISRLTATLSKTIGSLNLIKKSVSENILLQIYNSLIHSKLCYGILVWGHKSYKLNKIQKRAIRVITNSRFNAHTEPLFKRLNILRSEDINKLQIYKFLHKLENNGVPEYFQNIEILKSKDIHNYNTRSKNQYYNTFHRRTLTENCLKLKMINTLNKTEHIISSKLQTHSLVGFAQYVKLYIINGYQINCNIQNCFTCNYI